MTNEEAINHGKEQLEIFGGEHKEFIELAIKALEQTRWIPVSERLPEKTGRYLTYIINKYDNKLQYIMTCDYTNKYWTPDDECASDNVVAWMELPERYMEGTDEKNN